MSISIDYARKYHATHTALASKQSDDLDFLEWKLTQMAADLAERSNKAYAAQYLRDLAAQLGGQ
jgi:hypothetical protein